MADLGDSYLTHRPSPRLRATEVHCQHLALSHISKLLDHLLPVYISTVVPLTVYSTWGWWRQWSFTLCVCKQARRTVPWVFPQFLCPASSFGWLQILWPLDAHWPLHHRPCWPQIGVGLVISPGSLFIHDKQRMDFSCTNGTALLPCPWATSLLPNSGDMWKA